MSKEEIFSEEYVSDINIASTTPEPEDVAKKIEEDTAEHYDVRKPERIIIRAQIIK